MYTFSPNQKIESEKMNSNFTELKDGTGFDAQEAWVSPTLLNSWANYGSVYNPAGYYKDFFGIVHLRGMVKDGTVSSSGTIFTLPAGYRPEYQQLFMTISNTAVARCDVKTTGEVTAYTGSSAWFSLDGLTFRAA